MQNLNNQNSSMSSLFLYYIFDIKEFEKFKDQLSMRSAKNDLLYLKKKLGVYVRPI